MEEGGRGGVMAARPGQIVGPTLLAGPSSCCPPSSSVLSSWDTINRLYNYNNDIMVML